mmetsp:Transcript_90328/g.173861  ORF Transcript_90328/g.173861 Transcript_90328/m.173861 type:complete len:206 (-) Transcript_90328:246-863(-)
MRLRQLFSSFVQKALCFGMCHPCCFQQRPLLSFNRCISNLETRSTENQLRLLGGTIGRHNLSLHGLHPNFSIINTLLQPRLAFIKCTHCLAKCFLSCGQCCLETLQQVSTLGTALLKLASSSFSSLLFCLALLAELGCQALQALKASSLHTQPTLQQLPAFSAVGKLLCMELQLHLCWMLLLLLLLLLLLFLLLLHTMARAGHLP